MARKDLLNATVSTTISTNLTEEDFNYMDHGPLHKEIAQLATTSLAIILTNALVFVLFKFRKSLRSPANYLLLSLAVSDILTGIINIPLFIIVNFTPLITARPLWKAMVFIGLVLHNLTAISGIYHTFFITVERYIAITRPLSHLSGLESRKIFKVIVFVWCGAAILASIPFFWYNIIAEPLGRDLTVAHISSCIALVFLLPYIFITYAHVTMFKVISCRGRNYGGNSGHTDKRRKHPSNDKKTIMIFAIMAIVFLICWLPWFIIQLLGNLGYAPPDMVARVFLSVRYFSAIINPLLYTFFKRDFQKAARELICGKRNPVQNNSRSSGLSTSRQSTWIWASRKETDNAAVKLKSYTRQTRL